MLNSEQLAAVQYTEGPVMIIAGPGSGKTRVITERIAYLIKKGVEPHNILALTFTNKAATEMKQRVHEITNNHDAFKIWMGTFHSVFAKILRLEAHHIGYTNNFTIYDNEDSHKIIRRIIKDSKLDKDIYNAKYLFSKISIMKNQLIDYRNYAKNKELMENDKINKKSEFVNIYREYCNICKASNCMDFDDLLLNTYYLFQNKNSILDYYQSVFQYILIDEYQDTNKLQDSIIKQVGHKYQNICIVGDDSQSIYSFRGANIANMLHFKHVYDSVKEFKLEQNYRSTQNIVDAANTLISYNKHKINKNIFSKNNYGEKIQLIEYYNERVEGNEIAHIIHSSLLKGKKKCDHAILYRTNSQSKVIEDGLRKKGIHYKIFGGLSFYQRKEIKDIMAYLKLIINHDDDESLMRIINYPTRGIGTVTIDKIRTLAKEKNMSIWSVLESDTFNQLQVNKSTQHKLIVFKDMLKTLLNQGNHNIFEIAEQLVAKTGIITKLEEDPTSENINRLANISELFNSIKIFSMRENNNGLLEFINEVSLDETKNEENAQNNDFVSLMTIHQSKGLEFSNVYIVGVENGLFPSQKSVKTQAGLEEERRLLYVAITRAIQKVTISYVLNRFQFGTVTSASKSIFLEEIDKHLEVSNNANKYFPRTNNKKKDKRRTENAQGTHFHFSKLKKIQNEKYVDPRNLQTGQTIEHNIFGQGQIQKIELHDGNEKITVEFINHGTKILLTKFAKFKILN